MMIGLYKSNRETELETWSKIAALSPKTVRIYPVVILNGTRLGELYKSGEYKPMDFDEVAWSARKRGCGGANVGRILSPCIP